MDRKEKHEQFTVPDVKLRHLESHEGEREEVHKKTFTKWMNAKLAQHSPPCQVKNLYTDLCDGRMLLDLLEVLLKTKLKREKGNLRVHKLNNVEQALVLLDKHQVKLVGINGFEIVDGKSRAILGLMWSIILRFQVQSVMEESQADHETNAKDFSVEKKLLDWCKERLSGYEDRVKLKDFSESWRDGWAFNAILHSYGDESFNLDSLSKMNAKERLGHAFRFAESEYGIPHLLEPSDIAVEKPDKKLLIMYLTSMYDNLEGSAALKRKASVQEKMITVEIDGGLQAAAPDMDQTDTGPSASDKLIQELTEKLNAVENDILNIESKLPEKLNSKTTDLDSTKKKTEEFKAFLDEFNSVGSKAELNLRECRDHLATGGILDKEQTNELQMRMSSLEQRLEALFAKAEQSAQEANDAHSKLLQEKLEDINEKLDDVESDLFLMESKLPSHPDSNTVDRDTAQKYMEEDRRFLEELDPVQVNTYQVLHLGRTYVADGVFPKQEEDTLVKRMNGIEERLKSLSDKAQKDIQGSEEMHKLLLKQQLSRLKDYLALAERKMKKFGPIGPDYQAVQMQVEEHQKFEAELQQNSPMTAFINLDLTNPSLDPSLREQIKSLTSRWNDVWAKSEERRKKLDKVNGDWQKFRDEQIFLLNWLAQKEKMLRDMEDTDITDEKQVDAHLDTLTDTINDLEEQEVRLQSMQKMGEKIVEDNDNDANTEKEVQKQLEDFDDCWSSVAKQVIDRKEKLSTAGKKYKEFRSNIDSVNEWLDETEEMLNSYSENMTEDEMGLWKHRIEARCDERPSNRVKVDHANRLGRDLAGKPNSPSEKVIKEELEPFNERWRDVNAKLESSTDKGYSDNNDCCFVRIFKRKMRSIKAG